MSTIHLLFQGLITSKDNNRAVFVCVCVCVCVCVTLGIIGILSDFLAGGARDHASLALTKTLALVCEIDLGRQIDVPAIFHFFEWREAKPRTSRHGIA